DLVEVGAAVEHAAAPRELPHQSVWRRAVDAAEELRAARADYPEAPGGGRLVEIRGLGPVGPLVGARDHAVNARAEDPAPISGRGVDAGEEARVRAQIVREAADLGAVDARRDPMLAYRAAARRGVHRGPAVVRGGRDFWQLDVHPHDRIGDPLLCRQ